MSITKKDSLGRDVYIKVNDSERYFMKYYEETDKKKVIVRLVNKQKVVALFDRKGKTIFVSDDSEGYDFFDLGLIKVYKDEIKITLPDKVRNEYLMILRKIKNKK